MHTLKTAIRQKIRLRPNLEEGIEQAFERKIIQKGTILVKEHQYTRRLYFLEKGIARTFHYIDGKDITSWIYQEGHFFTTWYSFLRQQPSFEYLEVVEEATIQTITYTDLHALYRQYPEFERLGRLIAEEQLAFIDYFSKGYLFLTAKQRYQLLLSFFPDIELRVKLGHIASLLGISQETLSRIRSGKL